MYRKIILTCAAAVAALGLLLAPVTASAKSHNGNGSHHRSHHSHHKHGKHAHRHHKHHHMHHAHHHHKKHHWHHRHHKYYPSYETTYYSKPTYSEPSYTYSKPSYVYTKPAPSCTCLTKEYAPDGTVIFKDVCTKEMAVSEPSSEKAEN